MKNIDFKMKDVVYIVSNINLIDDASCILPNPSLSEVINVAPLVWISYYVQFKKLTVS